MTTLNSFKYDPNKLRLQEQARCGTVEKAVVIDIQNGWLEDFISEEARTKWPPQKLKTHYIEVTAEFREGVRVKKLIAVPDTNIVHPKSSLAAWRQTFGEFPSVGQEVIVIADNDGMFHLKI